MNKEIEQQLKESIMDNEKMNQAWMYEKSFACNHCMPS